MVRFAFAARNAGPAIDNLDARTSRLARRLHRHRAAVRRELDRVRDEIRERLDEQMAIAVRNEARRRVEPERDRAVFGERRVELVHFAQDPAEIDAAETAAPAQVFEFGDAQQRAEALEQRIDIGNAVL